MISLKDYLRGNKQRATLTKLRQFQTPYPDSEYGPKNGPTPNADADNMSASLGLGMGGEGEETPRKKGVNRFRPNPKNEEPNMQNAVPGDSNPRDRSYQEDRGDSAASNNHAEQDPEREKQADNPKPTMSDTPVRLGDGEDDPEQPGEDPNRQGLIRKVSGAHLVFKRKEEDGTYNELWVYKIQKDIRDDSKVRQQILAATDIPIERMQSQDGSQQYDLWTIGDVQMMHIVGLPN